MKDAALGMGCTRTPGDLEGRAADGAAGHPDRRHAGVARAAGETAPLLFTALFSNYWLFEGGSLPDASRPPRSPC